jgi:hypothetical protein
MYVDKGYNIDVYNGCITLGLAIYMKKVNLHKAKEEL